MSERVTLKQVAAKAGISYQTVSKVLNGSNQVARETAERILSAARELGYRPNTMARNLRSQRSWMIGYSWIPTPPNQVNHILDLFLTSMVQEAEAAGYHLLPFPYQEGEEQVETYREMIDSGRVDGFVLSSVEYDDPRIQFLLSRQFPFVAFGRSNPEIDFPYVDIDGGAGMRMTVDYLIKKGHRRIAVLAWPENSRVGNDRMGGFFEALNNAALSIPTEWVMRGEGTYEFGLKSGLHLLSTSPDQRPTAIVTLNDTQAIGAMVAAHELNLTVGSDVDVIGFDDAPMSQYLYPPLSSIRQPIREAGRLCVEQLIKLMEGESLIERQILLNPKLIIRASA
ncbi:MAG: LacI family transcriptional regulator [Chloroflexi bacterium HGW-Chloroflexi-3]|nr:MAG: LacI family transcriptional regulator [Chloroflexi bacterium HGW-Chloroflexi-3]